MTRQTLTSEEIDSLIMHAEVEAEGLESFATPNAQHEAARWRALATRMRESAYVIIETD